MSTHVIRRSFTNKITRNSLKHINDKGKAGHQFVSFDQWSFTRSHMLFFFHVGKVSMSPSYGSIGIGMSRIVSTWNVHHWLHYCFHISQQFIVSKETGTTESLPLSHISVIPEAAIGVKGEVVGEKCQKDGIRGQQWRDHTYAKIFEVQHEFGPEKWQ